MPTMGVPGFPSSIPMSIQLTVMYAWTPQICQQTQWSLVPFLVGDQGLLISHASSQEVPNNKSPADRSVADTLSDTRHQRSIIWL